MLVDSMFGLLHRGDQLTKIPWILAQVTLADSRFTLRVELCATIDAAKRHMNVIDPTKDSRRPRQMYFRFAVRHFF